MAKAAEQAKLVHNLKISPEVVTVVRAAILNGKATRARCAASAHCTWSDILFQGDRGKEMVRRWPQSAVLPIEGLFAVGPCRRAIIAILSSWVYNGPWTKEPTHNLAISSALCGQSCLH
jgi:hypothetical protein